MTYRPVDATTGWTQVWNGENRMVETWKGDDRLTFQYDYMGRRVEKKVYDGQTLTPHLKFIYDGFKLVEELDALNADAPLRRYAWQPDDVGLDVVLQMMDVPGNTYSFHLHDANKNIRMLFNAVGVVVAEYDYDPFGQVTTTGDYALVNPYRFSSEFHDDDTGLIYYNYRYDSPIIGRWISCDPIAEAGFMVNKVTNSTKWILDFQSNF
jgi:RHS repeat-associated protein